MKKIIKFIFSKIFLVSFFILLELIILIMSFIYLESYIPYFHIIIKIIDFLIIILILSKEESSSYKMPWIIIILTFNTFGLIIYLLFKENRMNKIFKKKYNAEYKTLDNKENLQITNISNIITNSISYPVYYDNQTKYLKTGKEYIDCLFNDLRKAQKYIFLEYFIIKEGVVFNNLVEILKSKINLEIRIIYDDFASCNYLKNETINELKNLGIKIYPFNKYNPVLSTIHNNRDHRKIAIIDGVIAYTGGVNIADEYVNIINPYGKWQDSGLRICSMAVNSFLFMYLKMYNAISNNNDDYTIYQVIEKQKRSENLIQVFSDGPKPYYNNDVSEQLIMNLIYQTKQSIYIITPYLIIDNYLIKALKTIANKDIEIKILLPRIPDKKVINMMTKSFYKTLLESNIKIYEYSPGFIHSKEIIIDNSIILMGTINLDYRSLIHHFECGTLIYNPKLSKEIINNYNLLLTESIEINEAMKINFLKRAFISLISLFAPLL